MKYQIKARARDLDGGKVVDQYITVEAENRERAYDAARRKATSMGRLIISFQQVTELD